MKVNPKIKALFPEKSDQSILDWVHNPCEDCDTGAFNENETCENNCILGRLWKLYEEKKEKETNI